MSEKSIAERLEVKRERRLTLIDAPEPVDRAIGLIDRRAELDTADVAVLFALDRAALQAKLRDCLTSLSPSAIPWVAYPKLSSPFAGDLNRETVRCIATDHGMKIVGQIAVDSDWSAMRLKRA